VVRAIVLDVDVAVTPALGKGWANTRATVIANEGADGAVVIIGPEVTAAGAGSVAGVVAAFAALRAALPVGALLSVLLPPSGGTDPTTAAQLAKVCDFVIITAYDQCMGQDVAGVNMPLAAIPATVTQLAKIGVPASKVVISLAWYVLLILGLSLFRCVY
jgi:hypothetical protein